MKKLLLIISFICAVNAANADVLFLNEGEEHIGNLIAIDGNNISFQNLNATDSQTFNIKDVAHILISKNRTGDEISAGHGHRTRRKRSDAEIDPVHAFRNISGKMQRRSPQLPDRRFLFENGGRFAPLLFYAPSGTFPSGFF